MLGIIYKGRDVIVRVGHIGINREQTQEILKSEEYKEELEKLRESTKGKIIIASVDKSSPLSGIKNKFIAYKELLDTYEAYRGKTQLIQYCTPGSKWASDDELSKDLAELSKQINDLYPEAIVYQECPVTSDKRLALFQVANILLVTALRDGFCLLPFEFMLAKEGKNPQGSIILSEFAGCVTAMSSIYRINPYNVSGIMDALFICLAQKPGIYQDPKFIHDLKYIMDHNSEYWLRSLIEDMKRGHNKNEKAIYLGAYNKKMLKENMMFTYLTPGDIEKAYQTSMNRVILLDSEVNVYSILS